MLEILIGVVFFTILGVLPVPTPVNTREQAEACLQAGNTIIDVWYGENVESALETTESFCFHVPTQEELEHPEPQPEGEPEQETNNDTTE